MSESLEALLDSIEGAGDPEQALVDHLVARAKGYPALAEAIRRCAIPRRFDVQVLGVVCERRDDEDAKKRVMARLADYPFVLDRGDGWLAYHDDTRAALLRQWHEPDKRERFEALNRQLCEFYLEQRAAGARLGHDFGRVAPLIQRASPERYAQLATQVEAATTAPLLEALYHQTLASPTAGLDLFGTEAGRYAREGRPFVWAMLDAMGRYLHGLPFETDRDEWERWLEYWRTQLNWLLRRSPVESEAELRALLERAGDDDRLRIWVLDDLADVLGTQGRISEAQETAKRALEAGETTSGDRYNMPISYLRLAYYAGQLNQLGEQVRNTERARDLARELGNAGLEATAQLRLADVFAEQGRIGEALDCLLDALRLSRTYLYRDRSLAAAITGSAMTLMQERAPRLLDAIAAEARALATAPSARVRADVAYAAALRAGGQFDRAGAVLADLAPRLEAAEEAELSTVVALERMSLQIARGETASVIAIADETLASPDTSPIDTATVLTHRGAARASIALWDAGADDIQRSAALMEDCGQHAFAAAMRVLLASVAAERGELDRADELLEHARQQLGEPTAELWMSWHTAVGSVARRRGRWDDAQRALEQALEMAERLSSGEEALTVLGELGRVAESRGDAIAGAAAATRAAEVWRRRAELNAYSPDDAARKAAEDSAEGILRFTTDAAERGSLVSAARDLFRSATERAPDVPLYWLNLAYACGELGEWSDALDALKRVLAIGSDWGRPPTLVHQIGQLGVLRAGSLVASGRARDAAEDLEQLIAEYGDELPIGLRAEIAVAIGDARLAGGEVAAAQRAYETALTLAADPATAGLRPRCHGRLGLVAALDGRLPQCAEQLRRVCAEFGDAAPPEAWLDDMAAATYTPAAARAFSELLRLGAADGSLDREVRAYFRWSLGLWSAVAFRRHLRRLNRGALADKTDEPRHVVARLVLNGDAAFFPDGAETPEVVRMLDLGVPRMRERVLETTGVAMPPLRIRATDLPEGVYRVAIDEVEVVEGRVEPGTRPDEAMLADVETVVRAHLDDFVDVDTVVASLEELRRRSEKDAALVDEAIPDSAALVRAVAVVRGLAAQAVPVGDLSVVLTAIAGAGAGVERAELLERARIALRADRRAGGGRRLVPLPQGLADAIAGGVRSAAGQTFLALAHEDASRLIADLAGWLAEHGHGSDPIAVVVEPVALRRFVAGALAQVDPGVPVLARMELE
jgi:tetratricopeptide (TPR) repeat protein